MKKLRIGFLTVLGDEENHTQMLSGIFEAADKYDVSVIRYAVSVVTDETSQENSELENVFRLIEMQDLDGLLFLGWMPGISGRNFESFMNRFSYLPLVSVGVNYKVIPSVRATSEKPIRSLLQHLIEHHGHKNIVYIPPNLPDIRRDIYIDEMKSHGIFREELLIDYETLENIPATDRVRRVAEIIFDERKQKVDAFFCAYDTDTQDLFIELPRRGLSIPADIAVVSNEDSEFAHFTLPPVTVVTFPWREIGYLGCEKMVRILRNDQFTQASGASGKMIIRNSCGCRSEQDKLSRILSRNEDVYAPMAGYARIRDFLSDLSDEYSRTGLNIDVLLDTLVTVFETHSYELFFDEFQHEIDEMIKKFPEHAVVDRVEDFLYTLRSLVLSHIGSSSEDILFFEDLFLMCIVLIQENRIVVTGYENTVVLKTRREIQHLCQEIGSTLNLEKLVNMLGKGLSKVQIPSCYIYLSNDDSFTDFSLLLGYAGGKKLNPDLETVRTTYNLTAITKRHSRLLCQVLQVDGEYIGLILFEPVIMDTRMFDVLARQVASALKGALLHDDLKVEMELRRYREQQLLHGSNFDSLTELYNRRSFEKTMEMLTDTSDTNGNGKNRQFYLLYVDFDDFKRVNDTYGHDAGDMLIREISQRFHRIVSPFALAVPSDIKADDRLASDEAVFRVGGDEFTAILRYLPRQEMKQLATKLISKVKIPYRIDDYDVSVTLSIGISVYPDDATSTAQLIRLSDAAMYLAKKKKDMFCFYDEM